MNNELNRYFSYQLDFYREINFRRLKKIEGNREEQTLLAYAFKDLRESTAHVKEGLAKRDEHVSEMRQGLIDYLSRQLAAFNTAKESAQKSASAEPTASIQMMSRIYWAAAMCVCSGGQFTAAQPVAHLDTNSNKIIRRVVAQVLAKLKKEQFETHLHVANFFEWYVPVGDQSTTERWKKLLYRTMLPVWIR